MKNFKILAVALLSLMVLCGCEPNNNGNKQTSAVVGEWHIESWDNAAPAFDVYLTFAEDGTFTIYQQIYTLNYEYYEGIYTYNPDTSLSGVYADGTPWECTYKVSVSEDGSQLTLESVETVAITSVYFKEAVPEEIKAEATATRAANVAEPLL